jgi:dTDP-glucose 4,6-dehydratase
MLAKIRDEMLSGNILVTGGLGFIGSHFIRRVLSTENDLTSIFNVDFMGYGSNPHNLKDVTDKRYRYFNTNINDKDALEELTKTTKLNTIVNFAAETHVDRSISNPEDFIDSNVNGVATLLDFCRVHDVDLFVQISTDEVYGDASGHKRLDEDAPLLPNSPYSASKAAADLLTRAYSKTYSLKTIITRCSNNFGPNQFPEKLIPKTVISALRGSPIPVYGDGNQTREWIFVYDHVDAVLKVVARGKRGEIYNISSSHEMSNIDLVTKILNILHSSNIGINASIKHVEDRPGHDRRYSLDSSKTKEDTGWKPSFSFDFALEQTVNWYINNDWWWTPLLKEGVLDSHPWKRDWRGNRVQNTWKKKES